ncbi:hypothetical protein GCM10027284_31490 [Cyclobacterium sediminis]
MKNEIANKSPINVFIGNLGLLTEKNTMKYTTEEGKKRDLLKKIKSRPKRTGTILDSNLLS